MRGNFEDINTRDWLAAQFSYEEVESVLAKLSGKFSIEKFGSVNDGSLESVKRRAKMIAWARYELADAMMNSDNRFCEGSNREPIGETAC